MSSRLTIHMMTAALVPGDALGNNFFTLRHLLTDMGCRVLLYADRVSPEYPAVAYPSKMYHATGQGILWYQYSIGADNLACAENSIDYRVMDFQGVSPPHLFAGYDAHLEKLCRLGEERLPHMRDRFDLCIVHSDYSQRLLRDAGYQQRIEKLPMVVDAARYNGHADERLAQWLQQIEYMLFVGRVVPQKDILGMLRIFAEFRQEHADAVFIIAGRRDMAGGYQREIDRTIKKLRLEKRVLFVGHINDTAILASLYRHARVTLIASELESFCVPVVESMHFGTPVVAHAVPPVPEVMGPGGIVIDKHNPRDAASRIAAIWYDSAQREALRMAARKRAQDFTAPVLRRELLAMLQRVFA